MNGMDILLIVVIAVAIRSAIRYIMKHKGSCCGDCTQCQKGHCSSNSCKERE